MAVEKINCESSNDYTIIKYSYNIFSKANCLVKYYSNRNDMFEANEIIKDVYLGDINSVYDIKTLKKLGITNIISVIYGFEAPYPDDFDYLIIDALDNGNTNLIEKFDITNSFIEKTLDNQGKILVHCQYGRSRSVTILMAYIIKFFGMDIDNCIKSIKNKRNIIEPNNNFINQLKKYYELLYNNLQ